MTVLVTGAGGFVGSHILSAFLTRSDYDVVALDSFRDNGITDRITDAVGTEWHRTRVVRHDMRARLSPKMLSDLRPVDVIVNVASSCQVDASIASPADFISNNVEVVLTALEAARALHAGRFIQISTDEVYGPHRPMTTTDHRPSSPYAASKAAQEDICHAYARTYGLDLTIFNSANMFGERQSQLAFIPKIVRWLRAGEPVEVHVPGGRRYTYVRNVANKTVDVLDEPISRARLHFPGQREVSNLDLVRMVAAILDVQPLTYTVDAEKARPGYDHGYEDLNGGSGWADIPFEQGLESTVRWFADHPEWLE